MLVGGLIKFISNCYKSKVKKIDKKIKKEKSAKNTKDKKDSKTKKKYESFKAFRKRKEESTERLKKKKHKYRVVQVVLDVISKIVDFLEWLLSIIVTFVIANLMLVLIAAFVVLLLLTALNINNKGDDLVCTCKRRASGTSNSSVSSGSSWADLGMGNLAWAFETGGQENGKYRLWDHSKLPSESWWNYGAMQTNRGTAIALIKYIMDNSPNFKAQMGGSYEAALRVQSGDPDEPGTSSLIAWWEGDHSEADNKEMDELQRHYSWETYGKTMNERLKQVYGVDFTRSRYLYEVMLSRAYHRGAYFTWCGKGSASLTGEKKINISADMSDEAIADAILSYEEAHITNSGNRFGKQLERKMAEEFKGKPMPAEFTTGLSSSSYSESTVVSGSSSGNKILETAKKYLGVPYQWGGNGPDNFDCSGYVKYVYTECGITLNGRTTTDQIKEGTKVDKMDDLQVGDLVFFGKSEDTTHHVGIYAGKEDGTHKYIHAPQTGDVVKIANLASRKDFLCGRRFVESEGTSTGASTSASTGTSTGTSDGDIIEIDPNCPIHGKAAQASNSSNSAGKVVGQFQDAKGTFQGPWGDLSKYISQLPESAQTVCNNFLPYVGQQPINVGTDFYGFEIDKWKTINGHGFVHYSQTSSVPLEEWAGINYRSNASTTMGRAGCGAYTFASIVSTLTGKYINPPEVCIALYTYYPRTGEALENTYGYQQESVFHTSDMTKLYREMGFTALEGLSHAKKDEVIDCLNKNGLVSVVFQAGSKLGSMHTGGGHYVAIREYLADEDKFLIGSSTRFSPHAAVNYKATWEEIIAANTRDNQWILVYPGGTSN